MKGLGGSEKGVGGFGKDGVAFPDKGVANFRGRGEWAEAEERVPQLGQMVVRDQQITQPALHGVRGIADQDIVDRSSVQNQRERIPADCDLAADLRGIGAQRDLPLSAQKQRLSAKP